MVSRGRRREAMPYWWLPLLAMLPLIAGCSDLPAQAEAAQGGPIYLEAPKSAAQRPTRPAQTTARRQATTAASPRANRPPEQRLDAGFVLSYQPHRIPGFGPGGGSCFGRAGRAGRCHRRRLSPGGGLRRSRRSLHSGLGRFEIDRPGRCGFSLHG